MTQNSKLNTYGKCFQRWTGIALLLIPLLIGCGASSPPPLNVEVIESERPTRPPLPNPKPVELIDVEWTTIDTANGPMVMLTPKQFKLLSYNLAEMLRWIHEAMWRLQYYGAP